MILIFTVTTDFPKATIRIGSDHLEYLSAPGIAQRLPTSATAERSADLMHRPEMSQTRVFLKDPSFAALLAFLVPGLGHFYQRRIFKGALYCVCILGTFFTGLNIGHGQVVYFQWKPPENRTYAYLCQFWVGVPALPALAQAKLRSREAFDPNFVSAPFTCALDGTLSEAVHGLGDDRPIGQIVGKIDVKPGEAGSPKAWQATVRGTMTTAAGSQAIEGKLDHGWLEAEVAPWRERRITGTLVGKLGNQAAETWKLDGSVPRSLWDRYEAPLLDRNDGLGDSTELDRAHKELGGRFELGVVYTMIAGLLNILAIYDAYEGPAYEDDEDEARSDKPPPAPQPPAA